MDREAVLDDLRAKAQAQHQGSNAGLFQAIAVRLEQAGREELGELYDALAFPPCIWRDVPVIPLYVEDDQPVVRLAPWPCAPGYLVSGAWMARLERVTEDGAVEPLYFPASREAIERFIGGAIR